MPYLSEDVSGAEQLTNFVLESNKFRREKLAAGGTRDVMHFKAFMPDTGGERSVFRMDGLDEASVMELGRVFVAQPREKPLLGWGRLSADQVHAVGSLRVRGDEPPPRHAVIDAWPVDIELCRVLAMELASAAVATKLP